MNMPVPALIGVALMSLLTWAVLHKVCWESPAFRGPHYRRHCQPAGNIPMSRRARKHYINIVLVPCAVVIAILVFLFGSFTRQGLFNRVSDDGFSERDAGSREMQNRQQRDLNTPETKQHNQEDQTWSQE